VQDIADDVTSLELRLVARGDVEAWIDDLAVTSVPATAIVSRKLSDDEVARLAALARLVGYLRYFYPGDQSAHASWRDLEVVAVRKVLASASAEEVTRALSWLAGVAAPGSLLYREGARPTQYHAPVPPTKGLHLARWRRYGYRGGPFGSFREGIDSESGATITLSRSIPNHEFEHCQNVTLQSSVRVVSGKPGVELLIVPQAGFQAIHQASGLLGQGATIRTSLTSEVTELGFGITIRGDGIIELDHLTLTCEGDRKLAVLDATSRCDIEGLGVDLYRIEKTHDGSRMFMRIANIAPSEFDSRRDELDTSIGLNLRLRMPLAVWTNGRVTFPELPPPLSSSARYSYRDLDVRIATAIDVWLAVRWFFPYFDDLEIDWDHELVNALQATAMATTVEAQEGAIVALMVSLHDAHATVSRYGTDGVLPLVLRVFDGKLLILGALEPYDKLVPRGSEVVAVDGVPAAVAVERAATRVSSTPTFRDFAIPWALALGHRGELVRLRIRLPDATGDTDIVVPRQESTAFTKLREARGNSGAEISAGVFYVDLHTLDAETWRGLVSKLASARAVIFDLRGYMTNTSFDVLAHFTDKTIHSPRWQTPIIEADGRREYAESRWTISPRLPAIRGRAIFLVDGRSASACETVLQIVKDHKLGVIIGERTAGTNGNVVTFETFGRMKVTFTGMRVTSEDRSVTQGVGIDPDIVARPTVTGLVAGKDEVLDAAIRAVASP